MYILLQLSLFTIHDDRKTNHQRCDYTSLNTAIYYCDDIHVLFTALTNKVQ